MIFECKCGNTFKRNWKHVFRLNQTECIECSKQNKKDKSKLSYEIVKNIIEIESNSNCKLISTEYISSKNKLCLKCNCGNLFDVTLNNFKKGQHTCKLCSSKNKSDKLSLPENIVQKFVEDENYTYISREFRNYIQYIYIQCENKKHRPFWVSFQNFKNGNRCPICNKSHGERAINLCLKKYNIIFLEQYKFNDLKSYKNRFLRFDFAIFDTFNNLKCLIEYDGEQHFKPKFGEKEFLRTIENDKLKNDYCKNNNINLIRIDYTKYNEISSIIYEILIDLNMIIPSQAK